MEKDWTCSVWLMQQQTVKEDSHLLQGHSVFTKLLIFYQCQWLFVLALFKDELA